MNPSLPVISGDEAVKALAKCGFQFIRQAGSHMILRKQEPFSQVTIPKHIRDQLGLAALELLDLLITHHLVILSIFQHD